MNTAELLQVNPSEYSLPELEKFLSGMSVDPTLRQYKGGSKRT